ncbi:hypothetical protein [Roseovarius confluentis]|uniref:hypothetical protein n=1 Tax=Roseovarius confluentis TaxID=1852027 RepID=UPI003BAC02D8
MEIMQNTARWATSASDAIDCLVVHPRLGEIPFTVTEQDRPDLWAALSAGEVGPIAPYVSPPPPSFNSEDVIRERTRRLAEGFDYDFEDARGIHHIGTTEEDMRGWDEVTMGANAAMAIGAGSTAFDIITETGPVEVTALEWQSILMAATAFRQPIWSASFALQQVDPIPDPATWAGWP